MPIDNRQMPLLRVLPRVGGLTSRTRGFEVMTKDMSLIERLRDSGHETPFSKGALCLQAAAEIERLRKVLSNIACQAPGNHYGDYARGALNQETPK